MSSELPPGAAGSMRVEPARPEDCRYVWTIHNDPSVRAQSVETSDIPWEGHVRWFEKQLARTDGRLLVALAGDERVGVARFDVEGGDATISLAVDVRRRRQGLGKAIVKLVTDAAFARPEVRRAVAFTRPDNVASQRAFLGNGYRVAGQSSTGSLVLLRFEKDRG